ncbi:hypothetical protein C8263_13395 [Deinococcus arcticus]|uniref:Uncharacterized protein n=1 Tax=Deinococcus arcticus TaxID=2136176 RepID=A0A2T3W5X4_9DEIO|nr:hypothetical protein C8263_13395 [Deinococcus arcticus]
MACGAARVRPAQRSLGPGAPARPRRGPAPGGGSGRGGAADPAGAVLSGHPDGAAGHWGGLGQ